MVSSKDSNVVRMDTYMRKPPDCNPDPDSFFGDPIGSPEEWFEPKQITLEDIPQTNFKNVEDCGQSVAKTMGVTIAVVYTLDTGELEVRYFHNPFMKRYRK